MLAEDDGELGVGGSRGRKRASSESVHARLRRSVRARGHFPTEQAAISACISPSEASTLRVEGNNDGAPAGSQPSTPSPSPSKAESTTTSSERSQRSYTAFRTDPPNRRTARRPNPAAQPAPLASAEGGLEVVGGAGVCVGAARSGFGRGLLVGERTASAVCELEAGGGEEEDEGEGC